VRQLDLTLTEATLDRRAAFTAEEDRPPEVPTHFAREERRSSVDCESGTTTAGLDFVKANVYIDP
jgi:hypothetical protein